MNDFQYEILDRAHIVKDLIELAETNNDSLKKNILKHQTEIDKLKSERKAYLMPIVPGERIMYLLMKWDKSNNYNNHDIESWQNEIWLTLAEFEESLRKDAANSEF